MKKYIKPEISLNEIYVNEIILLSVVEKDNVLDYNDLDDFWKDWN